jgi:DNA-binding PadR family transcriptional regulator
MGANEAKDKSVQAMRSPVGWALLGLIIERPSYAYELARRFEHAYEDTLSLSSVSHAYATLDTLQDRALIEEVPGTRTGRQPKPHYRATVKGVRSYEDWLVSHAQEERQHSRLFIRQLAVLEPPSALAVLKRYEQACLTEMQRIPMSSGAERANDGADGLAARLIYLEAFSAIQTRLKWIEYARSQFEELAARPGRSLIPDD